MSSHTVRAADSLAYAIDCLRRLRKLRGQAEESLLSRVTQEERAAETQRIETAYAVAVQILERLRAQKIPDELLEKSYRFTCLACRDTGVEYCVAASVENIRPCAHCERGRAVLVDWRHSELVELKDRDGNRVKVWQGGPYAKHLTAFDTPAATLVEAFTDEQIAAIMAHPCDHDPLP